jgi:hypothetical protein
MYCASNISKARTSVSNNRDRASATFRLCPEGTKKCVALLKKIRERYRPRLSQLHWCVLEKSDCDVRANAAQCSLGSVFSPDRETKRKSPDDTSSVVPENKMNCVEYPPPSGKCGITDSCMLAAVSFKAGMSAIKKSPRPLQPTLKGAAVARRTLRRTSGPALREL